MAGPSLRTREREVERARAKLTGDLAILCSPGIVADVTDSLKQQAIESRDRLWQKLKAQAAANPAAVMAIAAGLGWRLMNRPPIATSLIGLGLFSLLRAPAPPLDSNSSFLRQSAQSLKSQGEQLASAAGEKAAETKDTITAKGAEAWALAKEKLDEWSADAADQLSDARLQAKRTSEAALESVLRQKNDLRDELVDGAAAAKAAFRDQDTRNVILIGIAGVAVAAALGIAVQKRITENAEG